MSDFEAIVRPFQKSEDLENCHRHNIITSVGLPEWMGRHNLSEFAKCWLLDIFGKEHLSLLFGVEKDAQGL